jgi:hypothetical protein
MARSNIEQIRSLLKSLEFERFSSHTDFVASAVPRLADLLGYAESEVLFDRFLGSTTLRADAVFAPSPDVAPWVVIQVKGPLASKAHDDLWHKWQQQAHDYFLASSHAPTLLLTTRELFVRTQGGGSLKNDLHSVDAKVAEAFLVLLRRPDTVLSTGRGQTACAAIPDEPIDDVFTLSRRRLCELLAAVRTASTRLEGEEPRGTRRGTLRKCGMREGQVSSPTNVE